MTVSISVILGKQLPLNSWIRVMGFEANKAVIPQFQNAVHQYSPYSTIHSKMATHNNFFYLRYNLLIILINLQQH